MENAPMPVGLDVEPDAVTRAYYNAAYAAEASHEVAEVVLNEIQDSRDPREELRRHLAYAYARGLRLGRRRAMEGKPL